MSDIETSSVLFPDVMSSRDAQSLINDGEPCSPESAAERLTREQVVDRILSMNTTASTDFLGSFSDSALRDYLDHLQSATIPRGPQARWVRRPGTRAVVMSESRE
ncbi:MAG: hypothetical protein H7210_02485 [Pyrinomonadaceae bacterium]|nr:hypothetical protein [Phycisphaerales bacterium]